MSLWAILASPLLAGNDVREMTPAIREILLNREVIAIDQDQAGHQGKRISQQGELEVWERPLADGSIALAFFNRSESEAKMNIPWKETSLKARPKSIRDLWRHADVVEIADTFEASVPSHGVVLLKARP